MDTGDAEAKAAKKKKKKKKKAVHEESNSLANQLDDVTRQERDLAKREEELELKR